MYKVIKGFENYLINEKGEIYSNHTNKILKTYVGKDGYKRIDLRKDGKKYKLKIHRLVLSTFSNKEYKNEFDVNHIDGNKSNNNISNLEWCTRKENINHAVHNGLNKQCIKIIAKKDNKEIESDSIYSMYDEILKIENIKCKRKTLGGNVLRAMNTNGIYYGYTFKKKEVI